MREKNQSEIKKNRIENNSEKTCPYIPFYFIIIALKRCWQTAGMEAAMKCPFCGEDTTKVIDSRPSDDNTAIRRRRMCEVCNRRFTTYEKIEVFPLMVVKKDQTREAYSREKLKTGIVMACHKRPIPTDAVNRLVDDIETTIFNNYEKEVSSKVIGELVMEKLKTLDEVAYVRFASVYRSFTDLNNFAQELENMIQREKKQ